MEEKDRTLGKTRREAIDKGGGEKRMLKNSNPLAWRRREGRNIAILGTTSILLRDDKKEGKEGSRRTQDGGNGWSRKETNYSRVARAASYINYDEGKKKRRTGDNLSRKVRGTCKTGRGREGD